MGRVWVVDLGRTKLALRWLDPVTGVQRQKSSGTCSHKAAERLAAKLESELDAGRYVPPTRMTWAAFRERYEFDRVSAFAVRTAETVAASMNHVERILRPRRLADISSASISHLASTLRRENLQDVTIVGHLARLRAALRWAKRMGFITQVPEFKCLRVQKVRRCGGDQSPKKNSNECWPRFHQCDQMMWKCGLIFCKVSGTQDCDSVNRCYCRGRRTG